MFCRGYGDIGIWELCGDEAVEDIRNVCIGAGLGPATAFLVEQPVGDLKVGDWRESVS